MAITYNRPSKYKTMETDNYSAFKKFPGNREVSYARVRRLLKSISAVGYIPNPIIVNEKMQVIDGQGRLAALKHLNKQDSDKKYPVLYLVFPGGTIKDCIAMNVYSTKWNTDDYISSFVEQGYKSYELLKKLLDKYNCPKVPLRTFGYALKRNREYIKANVKYETAFFVSQKEYENADKQLSELSPFLNISKKRMSGKGEKYWFYNALLFALNDVDKVDKKRLCRRVSENFDSTTFIYKTKEDALRSISLAYNYKLSKQKQIDFELAYRNQQENA